MARINEQQRRDIKATLRSIENSVCLQDEAPVKSLPKRLRDTLKAWGFMDTACVNNAYDTLLATLQG